MNQELQPYEADGAPSKGHSGALVSGISIMDNPALFQQMLAFAEVMAMGTVTVPEHLRKNKGDCLAVAMQAYQWGMLPFVVAQKTHIVNGKLGYEAQLVIAIINNSGLLEGRLSEPEYIGNWDAIIGKKTSFGSPLEEGLGVKLTGKLKGEDKLRSWTVYLNQCETRNSPLWKLKPKLQLYYVCAKEFVRIHAPEVLLGVYTDDELKTSDDTLAPISDRPKVVSLPTPNKSSLPDNEANPFFTKLEACKSVEEVEALRPDVSMMKGNIKAKAVAAFREKKASFTVPMPKTFEELKGMLKTGDIQEVLAMASHLSADEQALLRAEANAILDSMSEG